MQGPLIQIPTIQGRNRSLQITWWYWLWVHDSTANYLSKNHSHGSIVGPEFVDYLESPSFLSHELLSILIDCYLEMHPKKVSSKTICSKLQQHYYYIASVTL